MFEHHGLLEHSLPPRAYWDAEWYARERETVFETSWHFVAVAEDLASPGDTLGCAPLGRPVVLRNAGGRVRAFENVCLHRHCAIAPEGRSRSATLRCPYHAWEYADDGRVAHIPDARSFRGLKLDGARLRELQLERIGGLFFVHLAPAAESLGSAVGDLRADLDAHFGDHRVVWRWTTEHPVNWKVIAENAVESYHVPAAHPGTFSEYRPEDLHEHTLAAGFTRYRDRKPWGTRPVDRGVAAFAGAVLPQAKLERPTHAHLFPSVLLYYGEMFSTLVALEPLGPERTRHVQLGFVPRALRPGLHRRMLQRAFVRLFVPGIRRVMREDMRLWPRIQHGLRHARGSGFLSAREERVYAFQQFVAARVAGRREERGRGTR